MPERFNRLLQLGLLLAIVYLGVPLAAEMIWAPGVQAGHTVGSGFDGHPVRTCDNARPLRNCYNNYTPWNSEWLRIHLENRTNVPECPRPEWWNSLFNASENWSTAAGPQLFSWSGHHQYWWTYVQCGYWMDSATYGWADRCGYHAMGYGCVGGTNALENPVDIDWSVIWLHPYLSTPSNVGTTLAHEIGHTLGLHHHNNSGCSSIMYQTFGCTNTWPHSYYDIGHYPACTGNDARNHGIRCIYGYWW